MDHGPAPREPRATPIKFSVDIKVGSNYVTATVRASRNGSFAASEAKNSGGNPRDAANKATARALAEATDLLLGAEMAIAHHVED